MSDDESITMRAYDEVEVSEWNRPVMRVPYGSRVADLLNRYVMVYGKPQHFTALISEDAGTDRQRQRLNDYYDAVAEDVIEHGAGKDLDELALVALMLACSNRQLKRHAEAWGYMPWAAAVPTEPTGETK